MTLIPELDVLIGKQPEVTGVDVFLIGYWFGCLAVITFIQASKALRVVYNFIEYKFQEARWD